MDKIRGIKPSVTGACVGSIVGLVAITPACGYLSTGGKSEVTFSQDPQHLH